MTKTSTNDIYVMLSQLCSDLIYCRCLRGLATEHLVAYRISSWHWHVDMEAKNC